jgi:outer membrane immunogenic protein
MAADLARPVYKAAPPPPVYAYSWTGCYIGGNGGGMWVRKEYSLTQLVGFTVPSTNFGSHDASSGIGGVQAGCNYQFAGGWVVGIQGDYDWTDAKGSNADLVAIGFTDHTRIRSLASVTGRVGYAWDRFLGYVKGGGAWERDNYSVIDPAGAIAATASETRSGWTVGVGGEYAFTDWLSGFAEYDYYDFGTRSITFINSFGGTAGPVDIKERKSVFKVGLNVRFGYSPVVAKY